MAIVRIYVTLNRRYNCYGRNNYSIGFSIIGDRFTPSLSSPDGRGSVASGMPGQKLFGLWGRARKGEAVSCIMESSINVKRFF